MAAPFSEGGKSGGRNGIALLIRTHMPSNRKWRRRVALYSGLALVAGWMCAGEKLPQPTRARSHVPFHGLSARTSDSPNVDSRSGLALPRSRAVNPTPVSAGLSGRTVNLPLVFQQFPIKPGSVHADSAAQFIARAAGFSAFMDAEGIEIVPRGGRAAGNAATRNALSTVREKKSSSPGLRVSFSGGRRHIYWRGEGLLRGRANYLLGNDRRKWVTDVPLYESVHAAEVYPGIAAVLRADGAGLENEFLVSPGARADALGMEIRNADATWLSSNGDLHSAVGGREVIFHAPLVYQETPSGRQIVSSRFVTRGRNAKARAERIGFALGRYDHQLPLVIDPTISVSYTTFLGGTGADSGNGIAVDSAGNAYIGGTTTALNFPETATAQLGPGGGTDLFFAKIDPSQSGAASLLYLTYVGGSSDDTGGWVGVDPSGKLAFLGVTTSVDFPVTNGSMRHQGANDMVVGKLNAAGSAFAYSTYFGGNGGEDNQQAAGISVDGVGNVWITSDTTSTDLPVTSGAFQTANGGGISDGFFVEFSASAPTVTYCSYLGIEAQVGSAGIATDGEGDVFLAGFTSVPTGSTFPAKNAFQAGYPGGTFDGYVMEFTPLGGGANDLDYATYLGGSTLDKALAVAVDTASPPDAYITGTTSSVNFPTNGSVGAYQTLLTGESNAFVTVFSQQPAEDVALIYSSYFGGSVMDSGLGITAAERNAIFLTGTTSSYDFPALAALQSFTGSSDGFLAKFDSTQAGAASLAYSTFLGGNSATATNALAATAPGNIFATGNTLSPDYPSNNQTQNGAQPSCSSCNLTPPETDAILTALLESDTPSPEVQFQPSGLNFGQQSSNVSQTTLDVALYNQGALPLIINSSSVEGANGGDFSQTNNCPSQLTTGQFCYYTLTFAPTAEGPETAELVISDNSPGNFHSAALLGTGVEPIAQFNPTSLNFGSVPIGETSDPLSIEITNAGNANLNFGSITISQQSPPAFAFGGNDTCQGTLQGGQSCILSVVFTPQSVGNASGNVVIQDNSNNNPANEQMVALSGMGIAAQPLVTLSPTMINFGSEAVGNTTAPQIIGLKNTGSLPLDISSISMTGQNPLEFNFVAADTTCPLAGGTVNPGQVCNIGVNFGPLSVGSKSAAVSVTDNAVGSPQQVALSGTGVAPAPVITPSKLTFGNQDVGSSSAPQTVTLENEGNVPLAIYNILTGGANGADFSIQQNSCPGNLNPGISCQVSVAFSPQAAGARSGSLDFTDNAQGSPQTVPLTGTGISPGLTLSPPTLSFGAQLVGTTSAAIAIQATNNETSALNITQVAFSGTNAGDFSETDNCVGTLQAGRQLQGECYFHPGGGWFAQRHAGIQLWLAGRTADHAGERHRIRLHGGLGEWNHDADGERGPNGKLLPASESD